jgi:hypothetical protein
MGICYSFLEKKKQHLIYQCDTLNQNILFLEKLENRTKCDLKILENNKDKINNGIKKMEKIVNLKKKEYNKSRDITECTICMVNKVDCAIIPCGHLYCSQCLHGLDKCPYCRNEIKKTQKLFFI